MGLVELEFGTIPVLLGDLSDSWCYLLAQQSNQHYSVAPQEWWNMVSSFEFDADASSGHFILLL